MMGRTRFRLKDEASQMKRVRISGRVVAVDVTLDEYMRKFTEGRHEYIEGVVIRLSPYMVRHSEVVFFMYSLLREYCFHVPTGKVLPPDLALHLPPYPNRRRDPDGSVVLNGNSTQVHGATIDGAPDVVIEVVIKESRRRDYREKFAEYQKAGIPEYWIIDLIKDTATFFRLIEGVYVAQF
jgi:Uma2 family endonuclease